MIFGFDKEIWDTTEITVSIDLDIKSYCHALICGSSGSGKSYALLFLLKQLLKEDVCLYFLDPKNSEDFKFLEGYKYYYSADNCYEGFKAYYEVFTQARKTMKSNKRYVLVCDEYPALILQLKAQDGLNKTKYASEILSINSELLMLGRGVAKGFGVWTICQRPMATVFQEGSRDNYMVLMNLGRLSRETKQMLFSDEDIPTDVIYEKGEGVMLADGKALIEVKYPYIKNITEWKADILLQLNKVNC